MNGHVKTLTADKITRVALLLTIVLFLFQTGYILAFYQQLPPVIPLFNQLPWGIDRLGTRLSIFLPLSIAIICAVINFVVASIIYTVMPLVARVMGVTSFLLALLCFIFVVRTILLLT
ncbi:MAG: hypothetical protein HYV40_03270 [Candidatus Levybacteria bacterium]|nr:hypothetical protein [Candidatus Levybacteria bacterium]